MPYQHYPQSSEGERDHAERTLVSTSTRDLWLERSAEIISALTVENANLRHEVTFWRSREARRVDLAADEMPPEHYIEALLEPQCREVTVDIDDTPWTVGLNRDRPTDINPIAAWHQLVAGVRKARILLCETRLAEEP